MLRRFRFFQPLPGVASNSSIAWRTNGRWQTSCIRLPRAWRPRRLRAPRQALHLRSRNCNCTGCPDKLRHDLRNLRGDFRPLAELLAEIILLGKGNDQLIWRENCSRTGLIAPFPRLIRPSCSAACCQMLIASSRAGQCESCRSELPSIGIASMHCASWTSAGVRLLTRRASFAWPLPVMATLDVRSDRACR